MTANDDHFVAIETKLAWQSEKVEALSDALVEKEGRISALEGRVERLEKALTILAQRQSAPTPEIAGALDVDDPVPRSG
jgi:uncharacterized coiled-coil protein SlyX